MLHHLDRPERRGLLSLLFALVASIVLAILVWVVAESRLWLLAVILPPIWVPLLVDRLGDTGTRATRPVALAIAALGLVMLIAVVLLVV
jgi:hypothetical protein